MRKLIVLTAAMLTFASTAFAQIGSAASDLVFTPLAPCRILDTRPSQGGPGTITAGGTIGYYAGGLSSYAPYGGSVTDCGLQTPGLNIAAVAVNVTVVTPATAGFITVFPYGTSRPTAATVNFVAGAVVGNSAIIKVSQSSITAMTIYSTSATDVVADVVGFYSKPVATALECVDTTPVTALINSGPSNGLYYAIALSNACAAGYTEVAMRCTTDNALASATAFTSSANCGANANVSGHTLSASRRCCRIPGR